MHSRNESGNRKLSQCRWSRAGRRDRPTTATDGRTLRALAPILLLIPMFVAAQPQPIRVGAGSDCDHSTILGALFEAAGNPGSDTIHLANDQTYEEFVPIASDSIKLIGGFDSCSDATANGTTEIFAPSSPGRVLSTSGAETSYFLQLENLQLIGSGMVARGGVVEIEGDYEVTLSNVEVTEGLANVGGGIYIDGSDGAELSTSSSEIAFIHDNVAVRGGGGLYCTGPATIEFNRGAISGNTANGESDVIEENAGGGVALHNGCRMGTRAGGGFEGIYGNTLDSPPVTGSKGGGGVAALSGSTFHAAGTSTHPAVISGNFSETRGGGVYADGADTNVQLRNSWVNNNQAGSAGGGIYVSSSAGLVMLRHLDDENCHNMHRCSRLHGNSVLEGRQEHGGAIAANSNAELRIVHTFIEQNSAPTASVAIVRSLSSLIFANVVVANNSGSDELIHIEHYSGADILWSTLAYNALASAVISIQRGTTAGSVDLRGSIVWQPAIELVDSDHNAARTGDCVMAADFTGFPELTRTTSGPPDFMAADDLRLTPKGEGVDFCDDASTPIETDVLNLSRPVDHSSEDRYGPYDLGAYEWREEFGFLFRDRFEG